MQLSRSRRLLAPAALAVGAFVMLFEGVKLLFYWRLTLIQVLPAMWIWVAMFTLSLSIVIAVMMVYYVAVPSRLVGMKTTYSRRDNLTATAISGAIGAAVCTPPYVLVPLGDQR